jgi:hypothetical protein
MHAMAVQVTSEVTGVTPDIYEHMLGLLIESLKKTPGFRFHAAHPTEGGWRIIEFWDTKDQANQFFAKNVAPNLLPGIRPKRSVQELHGVVGP